MKGYTACLSIYTLFDCTSTLSFINIKRQECVDIDSSATEDVFREIEKDLQQAAAINKQIGNIIDVTEKYVNSRIIKEDFKLTDLVLLFEEIRQISGLSINITANLSSRVLIDHEAFKEAIMNFIENAKKYAFPPEQKDALLMFTITEDDKSIIIDYRNNGRPFPPNISEERFLNVGKKGGAKSGLGLGGAWLGKVLDAHRGSFQIIRDENPLHFIIRLPKERAQ